MAKQPPKRKGAARSSKKKVVSKKVSSPPKESKLKPWQRNLLVHGGIILAFYLILVGYFAPVVTSNKVMQMGDVVQVTGMMHEVKEFRQETGEEALWTSSLFSGMPAYQISVIYPSNLLRWLDISVFRFGLPRPANYVFLTFIGFYFLLSVMGVNPWLSGLGAAAYALSSYFFIILEAGHTSKANAIGYMAPIIAGIILTYKGKWLLGGAITAFFTGMEVNANHFQITYYLLFAIAILGVAYGVEAYQNNELPAWVKASGILILAGLLGVGPNISRLWTTEEYASATTRGPSELATETGEKTDGLDLEYAYRWSYGKGETFTLLIPNFYGSASGSKLGKGSATYQLLAPMGAQQAENMVSRWPTYWGDQPGTSGPVYVGALVCFLFVLGLMLVQGPIKWALLAIAVLGIVLSWGRNLMWLNEFLFNYFPLFNKFRAPSMWLVLTEFAMPLLGILGLTELLKIKHTGKGQDLVRKVMIAAAATGGLALLLGLIGPSVIDFSTETIYNSDSRVFQRMLGISGTATPQQSAQLNQFLDALYEDRGSMLRTDALLTTFWILLGAGLIWMFVTDRLKTNMLVAGLALIVLIDMISVNRRYVNGENFVRENSYQQSFQPSQADTYILKDKDPNYRVFNLASDSFNETITSYHHKSIGGYHAAKLGRYNDIISRYIAPAKSRLIGVINSNANLSAVESAIAGMPLPVLNMLNTRYLIINPNSPPAQNSGAMGNAWFVSDFHKVNSPEEEISSISTVDLLKNAIVDVSIDGGHFGKMIEGFTPSNDPSARISLTSFAPNHLVYESNANSEQAAVFSEIYYNDEKGWKAYIDGEPVPHFRVNYILRGLRIPAGNHKVEFKFEPRSFFLGEKLSLTFSIILLLLVGGALFMYFKQPVKPIAQES